MDRTVGQVAKLLGLSTQAIYNYERKGVISPARDPSGWRHYSEADIAAIVAYLPKRKMRRCRKADDGCTR